MDRTSSPVQNAGQLQEAIDMIVQTFDYPDSVSIHHTVADGIKQTQFEIETAADTHLFELTFDAHDDDAEPELTRTE